MFFLRFISFLAGGLALLSAPFLFLSTTAGLASGHPLLVLLGALAVFVFGAAYLFLAAAGHRTIRSARLRHTAGGLIAFQITAGIAVLALSDNSQLLMACGAFMCVSVLLFLAFVYPGELPRNHRPMRRRDSGDPLPN